MRRWKGKERTWAPTTTVYTCSVQNVQIAHIPTYIHTLVSPLTEQALRPPLRGEPARSNKASGPVGSIETSLTFLAAWAPSVK